MEPYKFSIDVDLRQRVEKAKIASISRIIRSVVPDVYQRVFVGMRVPGGAPEYWATAHHNPELEVRIVGMTAKEHADAKVSSFPAGPGEVIVAETQMTGLLAGRYQIIERPEKPNSQRFLVRIYYQGSDDPFEEALSFRDGAYWKKESAFGERYRITNGRFEIRDRDGLIQAAPLR